MSLRYQIRIRRISAWVILIVVMIVAGVRVGAAANLSRGGETARKFGVHEIVLAGSGGISNPFDISVMVTFTPPSGAVNAITVRAFYDGQDIWRARMYVSEVGRWTWSSRSPDDEKMADKKGSFSAVASNLRGKLRAHRQNRRWWATDNGRTFLNLADTAYILFRSPDDPTQPVSDATFRKYVESNVRLKITSMRAGGCGGYAGWSRHSQGVTSSVNRSNWCWEKDYTAKGTNKYWESFDLNRFQTADRRLEWLLENYPDMYIQLIMGSKDGGKWFEIPRNHRERTIQYMIARWSAWPQVYYEIANDTRYTGPGGETNQAMIREIGEYMAEIEPFGTLRSAGTKRDASNPFTLRSDWRWHTYLHTQETAEVDAHVCDHYYNELNVPVHIYHGEDLYEQDTRSVEATLADPRYYFRRLFWSVLLSGGSPTYGGRYAVLHPYDTTDGRKWHVSNGSLVFDKQLVGLDHIAHIRDFLEQRGIDLALFVPDDDVAAVIPSANPEPNGPSRAQCARRGRDDFLIYLPCVKDGERSGGAGGSDQQKSRGSCRVDERKTPCVRVDLREAAGRFRTEWYQTANGQLHPGPLLEGGKVRELTSPWRGADVVVRLWKDEQRQLKPTDIE